jgi:hypothetical protein
MSFGKVSQPLVTSAGKPFLSGVGPGGRGVTAAGPKAVVFASPIAAWQPGATKHQVEMSWTLYHVCGIDENLPAGARTMAWSTPVEVRVTGNRIAVIK